ncbi:MAG: hypothetical protein WC010_04585 [Candidatus Absconditabacterales bacterium]
MSEFDPKLHVLRIRSDTDKITRTKTQQKNNIEKLFEELKKAYPLPEAEIQVLDKEGYKTLESKLYILMRTWLKVTDADRIDYFDYDEILRFRSADICIEALPQVNKLLACVGLFAELDQSENRHILIKDLPISVL